MVVKQLSFLATDNEYSKYIVKNNSSKLWLVAKYDGFKWLYLVIVRHQNLLLG